MRDLYGYLYQMVTSDEFYDPFAYLRTFHFNTMRVKYRIFLFDICMLYEYKHFTVISGKNTAQKQHLIKHMLSVVYERAHRIENNDNIIFQVFF